MGQLQFGVIIGKWFAPGGGLSPGLRKISRYTLVSPTQCFFFPVTFFWVPVTIFAKVPVTSKKCPWQFWTKKSGRDIFLSARDKNPKLCPWHGFCARDIFRCLDKSARDTKIHARDNIYNFFSFSIRNYRLSVGISHLKFLHGTMVSTRYHSLAVIGCWVRFLMGASFYWL